MKKSFNTYLPRLAIEERVNNFLNEKLPGIDKNQYAKDREKSIFFASSYLSENEDNEDAIKNLETFHFNDIRFDNWVPLFAPHQNKFLLEESKYLVPEENIAERDLFEVLNAKYENILREVWEKYNYPLVNNEDNYRALLKYNVSREIIYEITNKLLEIIPEDKCLYLLSDDWYISINEWAEETLGDLDFYEGRWSEMHFWGIDKEVFEKNHFNDFLWFFVGDKAITKDDEKFEITLAYCLASSNFLDLILLSDTNTYAITWVPFTINNSNIFETNYYVDYILSH